MSKPRRHRIGELVRHFKENEIKLMLEHPANVREALGLVHVPWFDEIDFGRLEQVRTTFVRRNYRHLASDIVFSAPLVRRRGPNKRLLIYILIEHQSEPDRLMPLRLVDSQAQIFRYQVRKWLQTHRSPARLQLSPVLPVVFYTGLRRWPLVGTLVDVIKGGEEFRAVTPIVEQPLFLNLPEVPPARLERDGGFLGWVLRLLQRRRAGVREFQELLERVVAHLEEIGPAERQRWRDLLSYIGAMVYHERSESEHTRLQEAIERSIENEELREEVSKMGKTMAEILTEEGERTGERKGEQKAAVQTRQQTLVRLLRRRFREVPAGVVNTVESTTDVDQLDEWLDRLVTADTLDELEIPAAK